MAARVRFTWSLLWQYLKFLSKLSIWPVACVILVIVFRNDILRWLGTLHYNPQLVLAYISILRWPVVALAVIRPLKPFLPGLIPRIQKINAGPAGVEFAPPPQIGDATELEESAGEASRGPAVVEETSTEEIESALTSAEVKAAYDKVYESIFGTQLALLKRLSTVMPTGLTQTQLEDIYSAHVASSTPAYPSFIHFIQYLIDNVLVLFDPSDDHYKLTWAGLYFLRYLTETGRYEVFKLF